MMVVLGASGAYIKYYALRGEQIPNRFKDIDFNPSTEFMEKHVETTLKVEEYIRLKLRDYFSFTDVGQSVRAGLVALLLRTIGNWFSGTFLLYCVFLFPFVWLRLYEEKKQEIDLAYAKLSEKAKEKLKPLIEKLPPVIKQKLE